MFDLELKAFPDEESITEILLNGLSLLTSFDGTTEHTRRKVLDTSGTPHSVDLQWHATKPELDTPQALKWTPRLVFFLSSVDDATVGASGFVVNVDLSRKPQLLQLGSPFGTTMTDLQTFETPQPEHELQDHSDDESTIMGDEPSEGKDDFDIVAEIESLGLLEAHATVLNKQIAVRKKAIATQMKEHRETLCLKHMLKECDGLMCKAQAIAQRICDKIGIPVEPHYGYATMKKEHLQNLVGLNEKEGYSKIPTGTGNVSHAQHMEIMLTQDGKNYGHGALDLSPKNPLIQALSVIAGVLGLSALFAFIRRQCMSMRKRVERAADREERRNARTYRRAARRAEMRRRWENFVNALNCFSAKEAPRTDNYEEKRALILQDAFLEQDLELAEKGEVMEAEIRELRHAHEIVSSLVRVDDHRYAVHDPPPPLVPLPSGRPRASTRGSLHTLPSYTSESLPDYTSRPDHDRCTTCSSSSSVANHGLESTTDGAEGRRTPTSVTSEDGSNGSRRSRFSPTSSVLEMSPRPSQETLRTRHSRSDC